MWYDNGLLKSIWFIGWNFNELTKDLAWNSFYLLQLESSLIGGKEKSEHPDFVCMSGHP